MAPRKIFRFRYLLVVTKRRFDICKFCVGEAKASPPTASRLSPFASLRAALQGASREKHIRCLCISQRHPARAAGKVKAKALPNQPILDVRLCAQDGGTLRKYQPRRLSKSRRELGRSRRERPSALSWFVLCRAAKNEHQNHTARREAVRASVEVVA